MTHRLDLSRIAAEPYEHRGVNHSEMALIIETCLDLGIETFIESGRARAQSTYMLAKYLPHVEIHSIELRDDQDARFGIQRAGVWPNVRLHHGDARQLLPELAAKASPSATAVLCDGPKGFVAIDLIRECFRLPHVKVGFIHDMRRLDHGAPSPGRIVAIETFPNHRFSDDPELLERYGWLDQKIMEAGGPSGPAHEAEFGSPGPTVGVFYPQ
jgi:hypothetical protein